MPDEEEPGFESLKYLLRIDVELLLWGACAMLGEVHGTTTEHELAFVKSILMETKESM